MLVRFLLLLSSVILISTSAFAHETDYSRLELIKKNDSVSVDFATPISENSKVELFFPDSWNEVASFGFVNQSDKTINYQYVFEISGQKSPILIKRTGNHQAPLIINYSDDQNNFTDVVLTDVAEWFLPFGKNNKMDTFINFTLLGVEHILIGFDHLLFVLALLFLVKRKELIWAISSFTLAHSVTLALSTFQIIMLPIGVVEALIAFSIVLLALEMLKPENERITKNYIQMAFLFGLLHGFGFASVLSELNSAGTDISISLLAFNIGVEIGQLIFIGIILILLYLFYKNQSLMTLSKRLSYPIGGIASFWFIERIIGIL